MSGDDEVTFEGDQLIGEDVVVARCAPPTPAVIGRRVPDLRPTEEGGERDADG